MRKLCDKILFNLLDNDLIQVRFIDESEEENKDYFYVRKEEFLWTIRRFLMTLKPPLMTKEVET